MDKPVVTGSAPSQTMSESRVLAISLIPSRKEVTGLAATELVPRFFKAHYEMIADKICEEYIKGNQETQTALFSLAIKFAVMFEHDNARFKRETFLRRCGMQ